MEVRPGRVACIAAIAEKVADLHVLPLAHLDEVKMRVERRKAVFVPYHGPAPIRGATTGLIGVTYTYYDPVSCCFNGCSGRSTKIDPVVCAGDIETLCVGAFSELLCNKNIIKRICEHFCSGFWEAVGIDLGAKCSLIIIDLTLKLFFTRLFFF